MIANSLGDIVLRQVPAELALGVKAGQFEVFGSIIKSATSGHIVGHLQEAGGMAKLISSGPLAPIKLLADGMQIAQNEQLKTSLAGVRAGIETLQNLGVLNVALSAAGIGVTVAGMIMLGHKIDAVKQEVASLREGLDRISQDVEGLRRDMIQADLDVLRAVALAMDEAWGLRAKAAERQWHGVAEDALRLSVVFERRA